MPQLSKLTWVGFAAVAAMVIGAFGPWVKAIGLVNLSISGTDGSNDGWLVVVAAVVGAVAFLGYIKGYRTPGAIVAILAGIGGAAVTVYDRSNISDKIGEAGDETSLAVFQIGWGLNLAMAASIALAVFATIILIRTADEQVKATPVAPAADGE